MLIGGQYSKFVYVGSVAILLEASNYFKVHIHCFFDVAYTLPQLLLESISNCIRHLGLFIGTSIDDRPELFVFLTCTDIQILK